MYVSPVNSKEVFRKSPLTTDDSNNNNQILPAKESKRNIKKQTENCPANWHQIHEKGGNEMQIKYLGDGNNLLELCVSVCMFSLLLCDTILGNGYLVLLLIITHTCNGTATFQTIFIQTHLKFYWQNFNPLWYSFRMARHAKEKRRITNTTKKNGKCKQITKQKEGKSGRGKLNAHECVNDKERK